MTEVKGLCQKCFASQVELVIVGEPVPICKKCKYPNKPEITIDESKVT